MRYLAAASIALLCSDGLFSVSSFVLADDRESAAAMETAHVRWEIAGDGRSLSLVDKTTGTDYLAQQRPFSLVKKGDQLHPASQVVAKENRWHVAYGSAQVEVVMEVGTHQDYFSLTVVSVSDPAVEQLTMLDIPLTLKGRPDEAFSACVLAGNLSTRVREIPGPSPHLSAVAYQRFGIMGATVGVVACPTEQLRGALKQAVAGLPGLPRHRNPAIKPLGGPWALDGAVNRGSYLFDFGSLTEQSVDRWIATVRQLGFNQISFHTGRSLRFGDYEPNPELFPRGRASVRAVVQRLHDAGVAAGLHTYAFFIAKDSRYVTPQPDPRLGKDATFTLAAAIDEVNGSIPVAESTADVSTITGFFARNSVTLQIGNELIVFKGVNKEPPFGFTDCVRGAHGTTVSSHEAGTPVHQLKECFGLFAPDPETTLLAEIAANTAEVFNDCGFDMIYLDALDGEDILGGADAGWHYGSKFVYELVRRLERPALMEMSTFHHHLWCVRGRMGAWDHPARSHKRFIDVHCAANQAGSGMLLPMNLGWWAAKTWQSGSAATYSEPTYPDDIEYLLCKALGNDMSLSLMGVNPDTIDDSPLYRRLLPLFHHYENLRYSGRVEESIKRQLRVPGEEFTLVMDPDGQAHFCPIAYELHKVDSLDPRTTQWSVTNRFAAQTPRLRIEALPAAAPYDAPEAVVLEAFERPPALDQRLAAQGVDLQLHSVAPRPGDRSAARLTATSSRSERTGSWASIGRRFDPPLEISQQPALGVWIRGDGSGALVNLQLRSADHAAAGGIGDHYIPLDFQGWRYFRLVEIEAGRIAQYAWPYGTPYSIYREGVDFGAVESFSLWVNELPSNSPVECELGPIKALPLVETPVRQPAVTINGVTLSFPVEIPCGAVLEFHPSEGCRLYGRRGELLAEITIQGDTPQLKPGANSVSFSCQAEGETGTRARVTVSAAGDVLVP